MSTTNVIFQRCVSGSSLKSVVHVCGKMSQLSEGYLGITSEQDDLRRNLQLYKIEGLVPYKRKNLRNYEDSVASVIAVDHVDVSDHHEPPLTTNWLLQPAKQRVFHKNCGKANDSSCFLRQWGDVQTDKQLDQASASGGRRRLHRAIDPKTLFFSRWVRDPSTKSMELMVDRRPGLASHFTVTAPEGMDFHDVYRREKKACKDVLHLKDQLEQSGALVAKHDAPTQDRVSPNTHERLLEIPDTENEWFVDPDKRSVEDCRRRNKGLEDHLSRSLIVHASLPVANELGTRCNRDLHPSTTSLGSWHTFPAIDTPDTERRCRRQVHTQWMPRESRRLSELLQEEQLGELQSSKSVLCGDLAIHDMSDPEPSEETVSRQSQ